MSDDVQVLNDRWSMIESGMRRAAEMTVKDVADLTLTLAKANIVDLDIIDTGNMLNSGYTSYWDRDNYPLSVQHPAIRLPRPTNSLEAVVAFAANYAVHHEYGTVYITARPFLRPAVEVAQTKIPGLHARRLREAGL